MINVTVVVTAVASIAMIVSLGPMDGGGSGAFG